MVNFSNQKEVYKLLNGAYSEKTPVGYCHNISHKGYISNALYKSHNCKKKECPFFQINNLHPLFKQKKCDLNKKKFFQELKKEYLSGKITYHEYQKKLKDNK